MDKELDDLLDDTFFKVLEETSKLKKGESKEIECPKCKNKMYISKSGYNGHIFAKCQTETCICIMQ